MEPALVVARTAELQRERAAAEAVLAKAPPPPSPLTLDEVVYTLSGLHDVPSLLAEVDPEDRAELHRALGVSLAYRRSEGIEQVKLQVNLGVDLGRVGGASRTLATPPVEITARPAFGGVTSAFTSPALTDSRFGVAKDLGSQRARSIQGWTSGRWSWARTIGSVRSRSQLLGPDSRPVALPGVEYDRSKVRSAGIVILPLHIRWSDPVVRSRLGRPQGSPTGVRAGTP